MSVGGVEVGLGGWMDEMKWAGEGGDEGELKEMEKNRLGVRNKERMRERK